MKKKDYFFPGDSEPAVPIRIRRGKQVRPEIGFNPSYVPLIGQARRSRAGMIAQWELSNDAFIANTLLRQEEGDKPMLAGLQAILGTSFSDWRSALIIESRKNPYAREELSQLLVAATISGDSRELDLFARRVKKLAEVEESIPNSKIKCCALLYVCGEKLNTGCYPTQAEVRRHLISIGFPMIEDRRKNEARDVFNGPVLGELPKGKGGRRRNTPQK